MASAARLPAFSDSPLRPLSRIAAGAAECRGSDSSRARRSACGVEWVAITDAQGRFVLSELPDGHYGVLVAREGYVPYRTTVELRGGVSVSLAITLQPGKVTVP